MGNFAADSLSPRSLEIIRGIGFIAAVPLLLSGLLPPWWHLVELFAVLLLLWAAGPARCWRVLRGRAPESALWLPLFAAACALLTPFWTLFGLGPCLLGLGAAVLALHLPVLRSVSLARTGTGKADEPAQPPIAIFALEVVPMLMGVVLVFAVLAWPVVALFPRYFVHFHIGPAPVDMVFAKALMLMLTVLLLANPHALKRAGIAAFEAAPAAAARLRMGFSNLPVIDLLRRCTIACFPLRGLIAVDTPSDGLRVSDVVPVPGVPVKHLLALAAAAESAACHPVAEAIRLKAGHEYAEPQLADEAWEAEWGAGAQVDGESVVVGRPERMESLGIDVATLHHSIYTLQQQGKIALVVARGAQALGVLGILAPLHPESVRAFKLLRRMDVQTVLLTGVSPGTAGIIREQVGAARVHAGVTRSSTPDLVAQEKSVTIGTVCFVTAGVQSTVHGAPVEFSFDAPEAEDPSCNRVNTPESDLNLFAHAILFARAVHMNAVQAIWVVLGYHTIFLPLALTGYIHPVFALLLGAACGKWVEWNAARLHRFQLDRHIRWVMAQRIRI